MTPEAMERLEKLVAMLAEENERQNLVAAATIPMVWQRHIVDSAQLLSMFHVKHGTGPRALARSGHRCGLSGAGDCGHAAGP
jgi:16S rRNA G527 N7-methylase RsmG